MFFKARILGGFNLRFSLMHIGFNISTFTTFTYNPNKRHKEIKTNYGSPWVQDGKFFQIIFKWLHLNMWVTDPIRWFYLLRNQFGTWEACMDILFSLPDSPQEHPSTFLHFSSSYVKPTSNTYCKTAHTIMFPTANTTFSTVFEVMCRTPLPNMLSLMTSRGLSFGIIWQPIFSKDFTNF